MSERQLQFRVGVFVIAAMVATVMMIFQFGNLQNRLRPKYRIAIRFRSAVGISVGTPIRRNGVLIGSVTGVDFDDKSGGLVVHTEIRDGVRLWPDGHVRLVSSLLGDSAVEFTPGRSTKALKDGDVVEGESAIDPLNMVGRMEQNVSTVIESFEKTSQEWQTVGHNLNQMLETNQGSLHDVVARAADALTQVTHTMKVMDETLEATSKLVADPQTQENLRRTLAALPYLTSETQKTVSAVRGAVQKMDENLGNLSALTGPLSKRGVTLATHLENTLSNLELLTDQLAQFSKVLNSGDGSIHKMATDPDLYVNLDRSAQSAALLLQNLQPIIRDLRVFSDKVARHPELIGVSGVLKGSSGIKYPEEGEPGRTNNAQRPPQ
jgi:phospholipid/cholesterol/gamma-HCH transport system substrate-binding protein